MPDGNRVKCAVAELPDTPNTAMTASASDGQITSIEFFCIFVTCVMYLAAYGVTHLLDLPADSFERARLLFTSFVCFNVAGAFFAWRGLRCIPTRGLVHEIAFAITAALICAATANLIDLMLWLGLGWPLKGTNLPHLFFVLAILFAVLGMFKVARLWHIRFGSGAALIYAGVLALFGLVVASSDLPAIGAGALAKENARDVVSHLLYGVLNSLVAALAVCNWLHSRGRLRPGIRLISVGTFLLSLGCILFAILSAQYPVYVVAAHPVHLLLGVSYILIGLGVFRTGFTIIGVIDGMDDRLPPVGPLIDVFGEHAGWRLYNRVVRRIQSSEQRLGRTLRENLEKSVSIQNLENTLLTEAQMREELSRAKERAEAASSAKTRFLTMMSHELRTPLTAILGYSALLAEMPEGKLDTREFGGRIRHSARHLQQLIETILDFSSIETGRINLKKTRFPLDELVSFGKSIGEEQTLGRDVSFTCLASMDGVTIESDALMLRQILANLLGNAFKFTASGSVRLEFRALDGALRIGVSDTGIGIPEDEQERVFEPFFQISAGKTRSFGGVGLGLSIVKRLSDILGGRLAIESSPGKGTRIEITFPEAVV
ncbi:MAG TPA: HAMP domain-containing sensor histidine kinase [Candidatus Ozemobacteraceae bacterium]|nr:HAMP domain-containing sensor histidine kinase [Candidatus Ozemobacteraceae bacterium]